MIFSYYFFNRLAIEAVMVPREAAVVPKLSHCWIPNGLFCFLEGTTIWQPGIGLLCELALATMPFM